MKFNLEKLDFAGAELFTRTGLAYDAELFVERVRRTKTAQGNG